MANGRARYNDDASHSSFGDFLDDGCQETFRTAYSGSVALSHNQDVQHRARLVTRRLLLSGKEERSGGTAASVLLILDEAARVPDEPLCRRLASRCFGHLA
jgi:hypothetical protein